MSLEHHEGETGDWSDPALLETVKENRGVGVNSDLSDEVRFLAGVVRVIRKRLANSDLPLSAAPAVFFLQPEGPPQSSGLESFPMLDNGLTRVEGKLWFVSPVVTRGKSLSVEGWDDDAVFRQACEDLEIGTTPAILFETRTPDPEARYYPLGLDQPEEYQELRLSSASISLDDIFARINRIHEEVLVTPSAQGKAPKLWEKPRKHWPSSRAEDHIQMHLRTGLTAAFPSCTVRAEQTQSTGRLDLEIEEPDWLDPTTVTRHAVLELKVLRSFTSTGTAVSAKERRAWVMDGVIQASTYRTERNARNSALCCFDMRLSFTGNKCFTPTIKARAKEWKVVLRVWHIFASAKEYREVLAAAGTKL